jgi:hypothetical protein
VVLRLNELVDLDDDVKGGGGGGTTAAATAVAKKKELAEAVLARGQSTKYKQTNLVQAFTQV